MRFTTAQYLEKEQVTVSCHNNNASLAILDGQPVFAQSYNAATNFGTDVSLYTDTNFSQLNLCIGVAKWSKLAGTSTLITGAQPTVDAFEAVVYGFTDAIITCRTRLTSTDSWASIASMNLGDAVLPESLANNFSRLGSNAGVSNPCYVGFFLAQTLATIQTGNSSNTPISATALTVTADTIRMKVFVRMM